MIQVDIDIPKLQALGLVPSDIVNAISAQNLILPSGTAKIGPLEYDIALNGSPEAVEDLNNLPIKTVNGTIIYIRDVAHVRDGFSPQTNIVRQDGVRSTLISILKNGNVSTLDIVANVKALIPKIKPNLPDDLDIRTLFDQSIFVRASIDGVIREGIIAACLTALMILLFLGDWKSTMIIAVSIPLSVLSSILILSMLGETINIMTLGGLALAVGILVDDATVTIENIDRYLEKGMDLHEAILEGASQIAVPAFVSTLCICIVFVPMFLLSGVARFLFLAAPGRVGGVRRDGLLHPFADPRSHPGDVSAEGQAARSYGRQGRRARTTTEKTAAKSRGSSDGSSRGLKPAFIASAKGMAICWAAR